MSVVIEAQNLTKDYQLGRNTTVKALRGVSFLIENGEFVAIMGPSGSGKSTLMHILGCLDIPTGGRYLLNGTDTGKLSENQLAKLRGHEIGFVFQNFNLLPRITALENVELPLVYNGIRNSHRKAVEALEKVGLGDRLYHRPNELSIGQQQRVAIARALINDPLLILADEPTGNLDTRASEEVMEIFQALNQEERTIVLVTHEPDIGNHAKRIIRLRDGLIQSDQPVASPLLAKQVLQSLPQEEVVL